MAIKALKMFICFIDKADPSDPYLMRTLKTPKKHTEQYILLRAFHQFYQFIILLEICKSDFSIVALLLRLSFLALYVICNVKGLD